MSRFIFGILAMFLFQAGSAFAQVSFEEEPINYGKAETRDPIALLQKELDSGDAQLKYDSKFGYLPAVLKALKISKTSQSLVYSRTSLQIRHISPTTPRALYFNNESYVGWVPNGDVIEVSTIDPDQGTVFYALEQDKAEKPKFIKTVGECLVCHASSRTQNVPGLLIRSVFVTRRGHPILGSKTYTIDQKRSLDERWGGWYVTGKHGKQTHLGNLVLEGRSDLNRFDNSKGYNVTDLSPYFNVDSYMTQHSDLVALSVLAHQVQMHNFITRANYENRQAVWYDEIMNEALERPKEFRTDTTKRRITTAANNLVKYMLFSEEATLDEPIQGTSGYTEQFAKDAIRDRKGRSLKDLDLKTRLLKYPCSYLIYSDAFDNLPALVKVEVYALLLDVLTGKNQDEEFEHLSKEDRKAILEILLDTKKTLPKSWQN